MELVQVIPFLLVRWLLFIWILKHEKPDFQTHNDGIPVMLLQAVFYGFCAIALVGVVCEVGQQFSNSFTELEVLIGQIHWYTYPYKVQRMLPMIIVNAQQPIAIKCFGSVYCERATFKQVGCKCIKCNFMTAKWIVLITGGQHCILVLHDAPWILQLKSYRENIQHNTARLIILHFFTYQLY